MNFWQQHQSDNIGKILLDENTIQQRVSELAKEITEDYVRMGADELVTVGILRGSVLFLSDLIRRIELPVDLDFMAVSSYGGSTTSSGEVRIMKDLSHRIQGRHVLIVEDIVDTGRTLQFLKNLLGTRQPASLKICTLLDKPSRRLVDMEADYVGFEVPDEFVVGYGLDFDDAWRQLPYIGVLKPEAYGK
ncbi:MAG: hypoxanthine phosphoribosyltransferase [Firmicutes bacterium]|nr:hypoxanthine phosphoribosyltransferase [Bacillota bacterium]